MFKMYILILFLQPLKPSNPMRKIPKFATPGVLFTKFHSTLKFPPH